MTRAVLLVLLLLPGCTATGVVVGVEVVTDGCKAGEILHSTDPAAFDNRPVL